MNVSCIRIIHLAFGRSLLSVGEIMWPLVCVKNALYICVCVYILWHDKQIYIQHFKIMKNVQRGHLHFPALSLCPPSVVDVIDTAKEGRI